MTLILNDYLLVSGLLFAIGFSGRGDFFQDLPKGAPLAWVVPKEGLAWTPSSIGLVNGGPNPNAAKLFQNWMHSREGQQIVTDFARQYSAHKQVVEKPTEELYGPALVVDVRALDSHVA